MTEFPTDVLHFEDFVLGERVELGRVTVDEQEVIDFGKRYDPQPFHIDAEAAKQTLFGGLIASGWHTCAMGMRVLVDGSIGKAASLGSPGVDEIRWLKPVRPGDTLRFMRTVIEKKPSQSKPDRGAIYSLSEAFNQRDELVMTMKGWGLFKRRNVG